MFFEFDDIDIFCQELEAKLHVEKPEQTSNIYDNLR